MSRLSRICFSKIFRDSRFFLICFASSAVMLTLLVVMQYLRHSILGTGLMLGWDTPSYVWIARNVVSEGPMYLARVWSYPNLYLQLLASMGYLAGDIMTVERVLPVVFSIFLIYLSATLTLRITEDVHFAGLTALLTGLSVNLLRLFADLHKNLMALSLSFAAFLVVLDLDDQRSIKRKWILLVAMLFIIANTHFETFFVLSVSLMVYCLLARDAKKLITLGVACAMPTGVLALTFPRFFLAYAETVRIWSSSEPALALEAILLWTGGLWILFGFFVIGTTSLFYKAIEENNKPALLVSSWVLVMISFAVLIQFRLIPLSEGFSSRSLIILPIPILLSSAAFTSADLVREKSITIGVHFSKKCYSTQVNAKHLLSCIVLILIIGSAVVVVQNVDVYLTPYIPRPGYNKILKATSFIKNSSLAMPLFVFYGDPGVWHTYLYRSYIGLEIGEHFAYYGRIEDLLQLERTEPKSSDPSIYQMEYQQSMVFYLEMLGNPPTSYYYHESYIESVESLMSHTIVVISPELFNDKIPYYVRPFGIGEGIYVIPPNSILPTSEVVYGPTITLTRDGLSDQVRSQYVYLDPANPNIIHLQVNGSAGFGSYKFSGYPSEWNFERIKQGGDVSFPEYDPTRLNGTSATADNDPADSTKDWGTSWPEQQCGFEVNTVSKKEGLASLSISGKTDSWGNLGIRYNASGVWDMSEASLIEVWAKASESAPFSITLVDSEGRLRVFYAINGGEGHFATDDWSRFVAELNNFTTETDGFDISSVDSVDLHVSSSAGKNMSFQIDDLVIDRAPNPEEFVFKSRVLADEAVVAYFYIIENEDRSS